MFLSWGGVPERGAGGPVRGRSHRLAVSVSSAIGHHFHNGPPFPGGRTPRVLRRSCRPFTREARRLPRSIASAARFVIDLWIGVTAGCPWVACGRSRTLTGQCRQPFCPGDPTSHSNGPRPVTKLRCGRRRITPSGLHQARELGPPFEPKRDASRTVSTWPLRRRTPDAGCIPRLSRVRVETSGRAWTRPGRIRSRSSSFPINRTV
jgi:hypothetical protein